jgi:putative glycosyltransferase (TIGR04372 family)
MKRCLSVVSMGDMTSISKIEIFKTSKNKSFVKQVSQKKQKAHDLWQSGFVNESIDLDKEVQRDIYDYYGGLNVPDYYPKVMSTFWTNMIGHFAFLGLHLEGQRQGILPKGERHIFDGKETANQQLLSCFSKDYKVTKLESTREWSELSTFWPDVEKLNLVKTSKGFEHIYVLWEMIWREKHKENLATPILKLDDQYVQSSESHLSKLGVNPDDAFVGIHIRESNTANHLRSQPVSSYVEPIKYLTQMGFKVIRLGNPSMTKMPDLPGLLDLSQGENQKKLHAYVLAKAKFFIATNSGPGSIPMLFNVPTLHTNVTSVNKNVFLQNKGSIYIPKKIVDHNNQALSYGKILQSPIGYSEKNPTKNSEYKFLPNSPKEIIGGIVEMVQFLHSNNESMSNSKDLEIISQLRKAYKPLGNGNFSATYLDNNRQWFLNV